MFDGRSGQTPPTPPSPCLPNLRPSQARIEYEPSTNACTDAYPHSPTHKAIPALDFALSLRTRMTIIEIGNLGRTTLVAPKKCVCVCVCG